MYFTNLLSALFLTLVALTSESAAQTVTYRGYSSTVSCSGSNFFCSDGGGVCCSLPIGFGFSAQFENLPGGSQGQGYTNSCSAFLFGVFGPGTKCWNGGGARASHLNWFHSGSRVVGRGASVDEKECATPNGFTYQDGEGVERTIKVPGGVNATDAVVEHFKNGNWKALGAYETFEA